MNEKSVSYTVAKRDVLGNIKLSIDVILKSKVSEETLRALAFKLCDQESEKYERIFICYYLPGMEIGAGAWATSHFNPNVEVKILGVTIEQEKTIANVDRKYQGIILGKWFDDSALGGKYTFMNNNEAIIMYIDFKDGSKYEKEMIESTQSDSLHYEQKEGNDFGEYYLIDANGNLGIYDKNGFIRTLRSIQ